MKKLIPSFTMAVALIALAANLHSQSVAPKSPADQLKVLKAKNSEVIAQQKQTLLKLEELAKSADQIRILAKRS